jgi:hypothetical protein
MLAELRSTAYNLVLPSLMRRSVIEARLSRSPVVFCHHRFSGDGERKPRVSVTELGRPLNTCSVTRHARTPTSVSNPLKRQRETINLTSTKDQSTLQFHFELHPRLVVRAFVFATAAGQAVREWRTGHPRKVGHRRGELVNRGRSIL